eukprot:1779471-Pyramimonas_sp.AAC.1
MDNVVGEPLLPSRSNVAGSSTATFDIAGCMLPTIHDATIEDGTSMSTHIGDISFDSIGCTVESCLNCLANLAGRAFHQSTCTLKPPIHMNKFNFIANRREVLKQAPQAPGEHSGTIGNSVINLGVACNIGKVRSSRGCRTKRTERWKDNLKRPHQTPVA